MVAVVCALPAGSRRARDQVDALAAYELHPARWELRRDRDEHLAAIWARLVHGADWATLTFTGTWDALAAACGVSRSTVARALRWFRGAGLVGIVHTGASKEALGTDTNRAPTYVLAVPELVGGLSPAEDPATDVFPAHSPVEEIDTPPGGDDLGISPQNARARGEGPRESGRAPLRGLDHENPASTRGGLWILSACPVTRRDRLAAAEELRRRAVGLSRMSARLLRHVLRKFFDAGWSPADVLWALDHEPGGRAWTHTVDPHTPAAWMRYRLSSWTSSAGVPLASRSQRARAEATPAPATRAQRAAWAAELAERAAEREQIAARYARGASLARAVLADAARARADATQRDGRG